MADLVGITLKNRYEVLESLGRGGMAEVYKVWDNQRAATLAMKVLRQDIAQDPVFLRRFQREAKTLADLQHPNIVRFFGLERDDLTAFLLMEYVEGVSLQAEILRNNGAPLANARVLEIMQSICSALHFAHQQGFIHCDMKPGNILIDKGGRILLTDFGIARTLDASTSTMAGIGTAAYMAPELVRGEDPTPQTDIYALGVVLFEMLTGGERPFIGEQATVTGTTAEKVRWEQVNLPPIPPSRYNPQIHPAWDKNILCCLQKDKQHRFGSSMDLLKAFLSSESGPDPEPTEAAKDPGVAKDVIGLQPSRPPEPEILQKKPGDQPKPEKNLAQTPSKKDNWIKIYLSVFKKYAKFKGRARRKEFWIFHLFNTIIIYLLLGISETIYGIFMVATIIPSLAVCVRRLHDVGKNGYFVIGAYLLPTAFTLYSTMVQSPDAIISLLLLIAAFIYSIWFIVMLFKNSQPGENSYGPNPKTESNTQSLMVE